MFCACLYGFRINILSVCCPTVADDMALISFTKYGQHMLQIFAIMTEYIMLLNVRFWYSMNLTHPSTVVYGGDEVLERTSYVHLGIECN